MAVQLVRSTRLFPGVPYAYAARAHQPDLIFTAGACPLDDHDVPSTLLGVAVLGYPGQLVEIEAVAVASSR